MASFRTGGSARTEGDPTTHVVHSHDLLNHILINTAMYIYKSNYDTPLVRL